MWKARNEAYFLSGYEVSKVLQEYDLGILLEQSIFNYPHSIVCPGYM